MTNILKNINMYEYILHKFYLMNSKLMKLISETTLMCGFFCAAIC